MRAAPGIFPRSDVLLAMPAPPLERKQPRGCGCLVLGGLGCGAFLFGATLAALIFAPSLLGGFAADRIETILNEGRVGRIQFGHANLSWTRPQFFSDLVVLDEHGRELVAGNLHLPPIWTLLDEEATIDVRLTLARLDLRREPGGELKLLRALQTTGSGSSGHWKTSFGVERPYQRIELTARVDHCTIDVPRSREDVEVVAATGPNAASGAEDALYLTDVELAWTWEAFEQRGSARGLLARSHDGLPGATDGTPHFRADFRERASVDAQPGELELTIETDPMPAPALCGLMGCGAPLELFGERVRLRLGITGDPTRPLPLSLWIGGERGRLDLVAELAGTHLGFGADGKLAIELDPWHATRTLGVEWPEQLILEYAPGARLRASAERFEWPIEAEFELGSLVPTATSLDGLRARFALSGPAGLTIVDRDGGELLPAAEWTGHFELADQRMQLELEAARPQEPPWSTELSSAMGLRGLIGDASARAPLDLEVRAPHLPVAFVDRLRGQGGIYGELFGPTVDVELSMTNVLGDERGLEAHMRSASAELDVRAHLDPEGWRAEDGDLLRASFPLRPLAVTHMLQPLLPWLSQLEARDPSARVRVRMSEFRLPYAERSRDFVARISLDLGDVSFRYADPLRAALELPDERVEAAAFELDLFARGERVEYETLPIQFGETAIDFSGSIDRASGSVDLAGEVPMSHLFEAGSERARSLAGTGLTMPVHLAGTVFAPRLDMQVPVAQWRRMVTEGVDGLMSSDTARILTRAVGFGENRELPVEGAVEEPSEGASDEPPPPEPDESGQVGPVDGAGA